MTSYYVDTNVYIKYLFDDGSKEHEKAVSVFKKAHQGTIRLIFLREVLLEIEFVLKRKLKLGKDERYEAIMSLLYSPFVEIVDRDLMLAVFTKYYEVSIDLVDILVFMNARENQAEVLSFDKDMNELENSLF